MPRGPKPKTIPRHFFTGANRGNPRLLKVSLLSPSPSCSILPPLDTRHSFLNTRPSSSQKSPPCFSARSGSCSNPAFPFFRCSRSGFGQSIFPLESSSASTDGISDGSSRIRMGSLGVLHNVIHEYTDAFVAGLNVFRPTRRSPENAPRYTRGTAAQGCRRGAVQDPSPSSGAPGHIARRDTEICPRKLSTPSVRTAPYTSVHCRLARRDLGVSQRALIIAGEQRLSSLGDVSALCGPGSATHKTLYQREQY